ncbi:MAG TPA: type II secretion protein ATPase, partial [Alphaproteobacteria bacterium]
MSDGDKTYTSILLPGARVALFTRDSETKATFLALQKDWRFARVELDVQDGDITTAISAYQKTPSPDLVLVQTDTIDDGFSGSLEALAGACAEGTAAIVIGPVNDVNLYRRMIGMGVSDYLVRPLKTEPLANDIAATLIEKIGAAGSRLIAMIGSKGGVGATVLA